MGAEVGNEWAKNRAMSPLERFAAKCAFDPYTGCVMWAGGQTAGQGHNQPYGSFWFEGRRWLAHRWAALHLHGFEIKDLQVDHCCPAGPSTLCVHHVQTCTLAENRAFQTLRKDHRNSQAIETRQYWIFVQKGLEEYREPPARIESDVPFHDPPDWFAPFLKSEERECPF